MLCMFSFKCACQTRVSGTECWESDHGNDESTDMRLRTLGPTTKSANHGMMGSNFGAHESPLQKCLVVTSSEEMGLQNAQGAGTHDQPAAPRWARRGKSSAPRSCCPFAHAQWMSCQHTWAINFFPFEVGWFAP